MPDPNALHKVAAIVDDSTRGLLPGVTGFSQDDQEPATLRSIADAIGAMSVHVITTSLSPDTIHVFRTTDPTVADALAAQNRTQLFDMLLGSTAQFGWTHVCCSEEIIHVFLYARRCYAEIPAVAAIAFRSQHSNSECDQILSICSHLLLNYLRTVRLFRCSETLQRMLQVRSHDADEILFSVCRILSSHFSCQAASVYQLKRITKRHQSFLLRKAMRHYSREEVHTINAKSGYVYHCLHDEAALLISNADHDRGIGSGWSFPLSDIRFESARPIEVQYLLTQSPENDSSLIVCPIRSGLNGESAPIGAIKLANLEETHAFSLRDVAELALIAKSLPELLYFCDVLRGWSKVRVGSEPRADALPEYSTLLVYREVTRGVIHKVINSLKKISNIHDRVETAVSGISNVPQIATVDVSALSAELRDIRERLKEFTQSDLQPSVADHWLVEDVVIPVLKRYATSDDMEIIRGLGRRDYQIRVDAFLMRECLVNVLQNARWANKAKKQKHIRVAIKVSLGMDSVVLHVKDEGIGIAASDVPNIFELGWTSRPDGTGMGLAIVRRFVEEWGGKAYVAYTKVNKGTAVEIQLPVRGTKIRQDSG